MTKSDNASQLNKLICSIEKASIAYKSVIKEKRLAARKCLYATVHACYGGIYHAREMKLDNQMTVEIGKKEGIKITNATDLPLLLSQLYINPDKKLAFKYANAMRQMLFDKIEPQEVIRVIKGTDGKLTGLSEMFSKSHPKKKAATKKVKLPSRLGWIKGVDNQLPKSREKVWICADFDPAATKVTAQRVILSSEYKLVKRDEASKPTKPKDH